MKNIYNQALHDFLELNAIVYEHKNDDLKALYEILGSSEFYEGYNCFDLDYKSIRASVRNMKNVNTVNERWLEIYDEKGEFVGTFSLKRLKKLANMEDKQND